MRLFPLAAAMCLIFGQVSAQGLPANPIPDITDCGKPSGRERDFCASRTLVAAELEVSRISKGLVQASPMWFGAFTAQEFWKLRTRRPLTPSNVGPELDGLHRAYGERARLLVRQHQETTSFLEERKSRTEIEKSCVVPPGISFETFLLACSVEKVVGVSRNMIAQRQVWEGPGGRRTTPLDGAIFGSSSMVVFEQDDAQPGSYRPIAWIDEIEGGLGDPVRSEGPAGTFITLPRTGGGNAGLSNDVVIRRVGESGWREIDAQSWKSAADRRLPSGVTSMGSVTADLANLSATLILLRSNDPRCCPTGGSAEVLLELVGDQLAVAGMTIRSAPRETRPERQPRR